MPTNLSHDQLLALARHGAEARLKELRDEIAAIEQAFSTPASGGRRARRRAAEATNQSWQRNARRRKPKWSPAARKAAAARMKAYWAKRKARRKT